MESDPGENTNLMNSPVHQEFAKNLEDRLTSWFSTYVNPVFDASAQNVLGRGQISKVTTTRDGRKIFADDWFYQSSGQNDIDPNL